MNGEGMNKTMVAAHAYVARGLRVFPCNNKVPATEHGVDDATTDPQQLDTWFAATARNIAIAIPPGVVVVDVDPRNGGDTTMREWCDSYGDTWLATAPHVTTGRGGDHYWFRYNNEPLRKAVGGIDFQRGNKYVVAPPSITADTYRWTRTLPATMGELPELPGWLLIIARRPTPPPLAAEYVAKDGVDLLNLAAHRYTTWSGLLNRHRWTATNSDANKWRHPASDNQFSATITNDCLFVYSPNTPFEMTEPGEPHGYTLYHAIEILDFDDNRATTIQSFRDAGYLPPRAPFAEPGDLIAPSNNNGDATPDEDTPDDEHQLALGIPINWYALWNKDDDIEQRWLIEPLIAIGRAHAIYAGAKTGKSLLMLAAAAALASGQPFLNKPETDPTPVLYADYEMTEDDIRERLVDFGFTPPDLAHLHYFLLGSGDGLDTHPGGSKLVHTATELAVQLVIVDTTARSVAGAENDADTLRGFYRQTGAPLKRLGIAWARLDHAGKDAVKGQRGTSAKNDDVDVVWRLTRPENDLYGVEATHQRMPWVPHKLILRLTQANGIYDWTQDAETNTNHQYPAGTADVIAALDELRAPNTIKVRDAIALLRSKNKGRGSDIVTAAVRFRKTDPARLVDPPK